MDRLSFLLPTLTLLLLAMAGLMVGGLFRWVGLAALIPLFALVARLLDFVHLRERPFSRFRDEG